MYYFAPLLFSFAASALAYTVTEPSAAHSWTASGPQPLSWDRVSTDPSTFTVVLVNTQDNTIRQVLAAEVNGNLNSITLNPPSGGWPQGGGYRLNLVQDVNHPNSILAQSSEYSIGDSQASVSQVSSVSLQTQTTTLPTTSALLSTSSALTVTSSTVLPVTATSSRSAATLPVLSSAITTSTSRVATPTSSATSNTKSSNAGRKTIATRVGFVPFIVALNYLLA